MTESSFRDIEIDLEDLENRYAAERAKRLRKDAVSQFQELKGRFAKFGDDPHGDPSLVRAPVVEDIDVLVIGGGFGGLLVGAQIRHNEVESLRIIEKGADFGGTWYWNRYPGAACDVEAYIYMPLLEELGYVPSEKYAKGPEIYAHCRKIGKHFDLYRDALFQTEVREMRWDEERNRWIVSTSREDAIAARFVVSCTGLLSNPKLPGIPGIETFEGHAFHTSRWDYEYTGGDSRGGMAGLHDKTVGIIGTGSTGIQVIPHLGRDAKQLYVFQRTPSSIDVRNNRATDPEWAASLMPGWQRERVENFTKITSGTLQPVDMVDDAWTEILRITVPPTDGSSVIDPADIHVAEMKKMEHTRRRIAATVKDPATAEALKPYYHYNCKRPCFSDEFLDTFNRPNVKLVDTAGQGVERITPRGVVVAGEEYAVDCLVFATGFDFMTEYSRESGIEIFGRNGQSLSEHWSAGARTLFGMQTSGFPNFFLMSLVQSGVSINYMHIAEEQAKHIAYIVAQCMKHEIAAVEPTAEAEEGWVQEVLATLGPRRAFLEACTPGYYNYEGKRAASIELNDLYAAGPLPYIAKLERWRGAGTMPGLARIANSG